MKKQLLVAAVFAATAAMQAQAGTLGDDNLTISGFGTLGVAKSNTDQAQFARYNQAEGVGDKAKIGLDTNLGLQATYKINDWLSGTAQILTRKNTSPTFTTDLTWAFLKARINDEVSVRVGRVVLPTFLISDYQNVGYANTMMRPPIEMYGQAPIENVDGADVNFQRAFGDFNFTTQAFAGVSRGKLFVPTGAGSVATYRAPAVGISFTGEYGPFLVRVAHARADMKINDLAPINTLTGTLNQFGFKQLASDLGLSEGKKIAFTSIGGTMDWHNIVVQTEYAQRRAKEAVYIPDTNAWYTMVGYRVGKVLPYYAHASYKDAGASVTPPAALPKNSPLGAAVYGLLPSPEQTSDLIGVRWDFAKSLALKVQVDRVKPKTKAGSLIFVKPGFNNNVTVVAAALDFVF
ncbi:porin [Duganella violaceipulchra]|uniref:Porin n=1 Tax=Duganella violaceipulchra TaxID=2849652 RepID=A0AA41L3Y4_9BURK|nr:porin [Duganella violaceicalia]MBV6322269.1 porin [Duganella violaceicalia]MCP2011416.1 putative porin [Duganella violaceicalia]